MGRSPESVERRRAAWRAWAASPAGREYFRRWRLAHPESERARKAAWRAANPERVRAAWRADNARRRAPVRDAPIPAPATGHPLFEEAARIVPFYGRGRSVSFWHEELEYDLRAEAVLALLEGRDPVEAVNRYRGRERTWERTTGFLGAAVTGEWDVAA